MEPIRVVFEGLPGAGKTTIARVMSERITCPLIEEFPAFSLGQWTRYELSAPFYRLNDELKDWLARQFRTAFVLFDRHYVGTLAYSYSLNSTGRREVQEDYKAELSWYLQCRAQGRLVPSHMTFVLDIPPPLSRQRQPSAAATDPVWADRHCLEAMRSYYHWFYSLVEPEVRVVWLDATLDLESICRSVHEELRALRSS